jgi:hypothetical protein
MNRDSGKVTTTFQHYIVSYIDVLGQRDKLVKLEELLDNQAKGESLIKANRQTIDVIKQLRNDCTKFWEKQSRSALKEQWYRNFTEEQKAQFKKFRYGDIKFRYISDGIIIYAPLAMTQGEQRVQDILSIISGVAFLILRSLAYNVAIRGAVELGWATKIEVWPKKKEYADIYGPILTRTHYIEDQIAKYPRIVVGERLIKYLELRLQLDIEETDNPQERFNKICTEQCRLLICEDTDGQFIVDFLGEYMQKDIDLSNAKSLVSLGYQFVKQEYLRYKQARDSKMSFRYDYLMSYFLGRFPNLE